MKLTSELQQLVNAIHVDLHVPDKIDRMRAFLRLNTPLGQQLLQMHPRFSAQCREKLSELYMHVHEMLGSADLAQNIIWNGFSSGGYCKHEAD